MRKIFGLIICVLALVGCSEEAPDYITFAEGFTDLTLPVEGGSMEVTLSASGDWSAVTDGQGWFTATKTAANSLTVTAEAFDASTSASYSRVGFVTIYCGSRSVKVAVIQSVPVSDGELKPGSLLIEEIFFTGSPLPSTNVPNAKNMDQYFLITNNSDSLVYADGLLIIESKNPNAGQTWKEFVHPIIDEYCEAGAVMCIPGSGTDVPVLPGESLLIASNAINYRSGYSSENSEITVEINPRGIDLSGADFEWYTESTNSVIDIDNPDVPNLEVWFCYTLSIWNLHNRGFQSYAIAMPPEGMPRERFLEEYSWEGAEYISHTLAGDFQMTLTGAYKVPNTWILDAVMCTVPSINQTRQFSSALDAGWTWCSPQNIDADSQRYGLSVRRKRGADGKLIDTNNSLNDFTPNATPSLREQ